MQISDVEYIRVRNEETEAVKDMTTDQVKARILDYENNLWQIKAKQQSCYAWLQEDERRQRIAEQIKNLTSRTEIVPVESLAAKMRREDEEHQTKIDKQIAGWRKAGISEDTIEKMSAILKAAKA